MRYLVLIISSVAIFLCGFFYANSQNQKLIEFSYESEVQAQLVRAKLTLGALEELKEARTQQFNDMMGYLLMLEFVRFENSPFLLEQERTQKQLVEFTKNLRIYISEYPTQLCIGKSREKRFQCELSNQGLSEDNLAKFFLDILKNEI